MEFCIRSGVRFRGFRGFGRILGFYWLFFKRSYLLKRFCFFFYFIGIFIVLKDFRIIRNFVRGFRRFTEGVLLWLSGFRKL